MNDEALRLQLRGEEQTGLQRTLFSDTQLKGAGRRPHLRRGCPTGEALKKGRLVHRPNAAPSLHYRKQNRDQAEPFHCIPARCHHEHHGTKSRDMREPEPPL